MINWNLTLCIFQMYLTLYWLVIVFLSIAVVIWKRSHESRKRQDLTGTPNIIIRKFFHVLAAAIFIPGIIYDPTLLHVCSAMATSLFLFVEVSCKITAPEGLPAKLTTHKLWVKIMSMALDSMLANFWKVNVSLSRLRIIVLTVDEI